MEQDERMKVQRWMEQRRQRFEFDLPVTVRIDIDEETFKFGFHEGSALAQRIAEDPVVSGWTPRKLCCPTVFQMCVSKPEGGT